MKRFVSLYLPGYAQTVIYMLQNVEYQVGPYLKWYWRTHDFSTVMYRRTLHKTKAASLLLAVLSIGMLAQTLIAIVCIWIGYTRDIVGLTLLGTLLVICYPIVWAHLITLPLLVGRWLIVTPRNRRRIKQAETIFANHPGIKIAIAGSYGKTSMKELLSAVLSEGKTVAATPANKNVAVSHAVFASKLTGKEDILLIEYGEGAPGDVKCFAQNTHPTIGVITGLAPAHLDRYPTLQAAGEDIFSLADYVGADNTYVNADSEATKGFLKDGFHLYSSTEVLGWKISNVKVSFKGTSFTMKKGKQTLQLHSDLLGRHHVGPLGLSAALADNLGLTKKQIEAGISKTRPFEHRMQPRAIRGAWIIDDTYNGNIDGMKAGLALLSELPGKRKIYVTPGLVDQGVENERVHIELGRAIAAAKPDKVVLMLNSATRHIQAGLELSNYKGVVQLEHYPLDFYVNLEHFIAGGDVVMLQNDWTDNYN